jgi:hypothetical protein
VLSVNFARNAEIDARLLTPEQVRCDRDKAVLGQLVAYLAYIGVHPEHRVQDDDAGGRQLLRAPEISSKLTAKPIPPEAGEESFHRLKDDGVGLMSGEVHEVGVEDLDTNREKLSLQVLYPRHRRQGTGLFRRVMPC